MTRGHLLRHGLWFALPYLVVMGLGYALLGQAAHLLAGDTFFGGAALGLNWLADDPLPLLHHPSYLLQALTGALVFMSGGLATGADRYQLLTVLVNAALVAVAGAWMALVARELKLSRFGLVLIGLAGASMPTTMAYCVAWVGPHFPFGLFAPPLGLSLWRLALSRRNPRCLVGVTFLGMGVLGSNLILTAFLAVPGCVALLLALSYRHPQRDAERLGDAEEPSWLYLGGLFLLVLTGLAPPVYQPRPMVGALLSMGALVMAGAGLALPRRAANRGAPRLAHWMVGLLALAMVVEALSGSWLLAFLVGEHALLLSLVPGLGTMGVLTRRVVFPLAAGFLAGTTVLSGRFWESVVSAGEGKGGALAPGEATRLIDLLGSPLESLSSNPWFALLALPAGLSLAGIVLGGWAAWRRRRRASATWLVIAVLAAGPLCLAAIACRDLDFSAWYEPTSIANSGRYFVILVGCVAVAIVQGMRGGRQLRRITVTVVLLASSASFVRYGTIAIAVARDHREVVRAVADFRRSERPGLIVCDRLSSPPVAGVLYAWNVSHLRTPGRDAVVSYKLNGGHIAVYAYQMMDRMVGSLPTGRHIVLSSWGWTPPGGVQVSFAIRPKHLGLHLYEIEVPELGPRLRSRRLRKVLAHHGWAGTVR